MKTKKKKKTQIKQKVAARVAALLDRKLPGSRTPPVALPKRRPAWLASSPELVDLLAHVGPGTLLGDFYCRMLAVDECIVSRELFDRVDPRGEWFAATWQPFLGDASGGITCIDTKTGSVVYYYKSEPPQLVAPSLARYLGIIERVLEGLPDPPDPEEDDIVEEELEAEFYEALRASLAKTNKPPPPQKPRTDVPKPPPPPDDRGPKEMWLVAAFKTTRKYALDALMVGKGIGTTFGKGCRVYSMGGGGKVRRIVMARKTDPAKQDDALLVYLDPKSMEAFVTVDDVPDRERFVKESLDCLGTLGFRLSKLDPKKEKRSETRWKKYFGVE